MTEAVDAARAVRRAFDRAAASYDGAAGVQREICARLAGLMQECPPTAPPRRIIDAGCGTGYGLRPLAEHFPTAERLAIDFAPAMLQRSRQHHPATPLCADLQALPLRDGSVDALWSSLALQWCDAGRALREFARVLAVDGTAWIATLGPDTLTELRQSFAQVDDAEHVLRFRPAADWALLARAAGLGVLTERRERCFVRAPDLRGLIAHLKGIGAHRIDATPRRPLTRAEWRRLEHAYEAFREPDGLLPASYDVILLALRRTDAQCASGNNLHRIA